MRKLGFLLLFAFLFLCYCAQNPIEPERPVTNITFRVSGDGFVSLIIYDQFDMLVKVLIDDEIVAGNYSIIWDGRNENGQTVASGLYYYTLKTGEYEIKKEMILIK